MQAAEGGREVPGGRGRGSRVPGGFHRAEEKELIAEGFSKGVALGTGITTLLSLCLILAM